ncbi:hypothetical protein K8I61_06435 [bacterium]|nr:hypothetical protein [bacterium]
MILNGAEKLEARGLRLEALVIGASALVLLGIVTRPTRDADILRPAIPEEVRGAAVEYARERRAAGEPIDDDWLNNGPESLTRTLPEGWQDRLELAFKGRAIVLHTLGRMELLMSKLFAHCDRGDEDLVDCIAFAPTPEELDAALPWLDEQDGNPMWPAHVRRTINELKKELGHGISETDRS